MSLPEVKGHIAKGEGQFKVSGNNISIHLIRFLRGGAEVQKWCAYDCIRIPRVQCVRLSEATRIWSK